MSVVARRFSACPVRTAAKTWERIIEVIGAGNDSVKQDLQLVAGIAASIISDGTPANNAITIIGSGPRLRIYCIYDEEGSTEDANETSLHWNLFESDWEIHFPVENEDLEWVKSALAEKGTRFKAYPAGEKPAEEEKQSGENARLSINLDKLRSHV